MAEHDDNITHYSVNIHKYVCPSYKNAKRTHIQIELFLTNIINFNSVKRAIIDLIKHKTDNVGCNETLEYLKCDFSQNNQKSYCVDTFKIIYDDEIAKEDGFSLVEENEGGLIQEFLDMINMTDEFIEQNCSQMKFPLGKIRRQIQFGSISYDLAHICDVEDIVDEILYFLNIDIKDKLQMHFVERLHSQL